MKPIYTRSSWLLATSLLVAQLVSSRATAAPSKLHDRTSQPALVRLGKGWGFSLDVPASMTVQHKEGPDFDVFYLKEKGNIVLAWYLGNWPEFPENAEAALVGHAQGRCASTPEKFSCLFEVHGPFQYLHIWSDGPKSKGFERVQAILQTLTVDAQKPHD
jgi:hypothetical protein